MPFPLGRYYGALAGNVPFLRGDFHIDSQEDNITATASGNQSTGYPLTAGVSRITTVATAADSVQLPQAHGGVKCIVINHGANALQVFGNVVTADTINDVATATGVSQMVGSAVLYACPIIGKWYTIGLGEGYVSGQPTQAFANIAANSTGTQASGTHITQPLNLVSSAGTAYSVTLPVSAPGMSITIISTDATNTVKVYPNAGGTTTETINALTSNAGITMGAATSAVFSCGVAGAWYTTPRVPS